MVAIVSGYYIMNYAHMKHIIILARVKSYSNVYDTTIGQSFNLYQHLPIHASYLNGNKTSQESADIRIYLAWGV